MKTSQNVRDSILVDIYAKLCSLEEKIKVMEKRNILEGHALALTLIEDHAKTCSDFQGFTVIEENKDNSKGATYLEPTITTKCSCNKPEASVMSCGLDKRQLDFFKECVEEINQKYKQTPIPKIEIKNITDMDKYCKEMEKKIEEVEEPKVDNIEVT